MNLSSPKIIKELLARYNAAPSKRFGQNFLINPGVLEKIIKETNLNDPVEVRLQQGTRKHDFNVLEIGPGIGTLTQELAKRAKHVIAIEKDRKMVEILKETMAGFKNVEIINADILKLKFLPLFSKEGGGEICISNSNSKSPLTPLLQSGEPYKLVANLPYYITSPVIRKFLEDRNQPGEMILMVQKEVAQRICAQPPNMSVLAVSVQFYAKPKIISYVSKGSFWPAPKVDSAILRIIPETTPIPGLHPDDTDINIRVGASGLLKPEGRRRAFSVQFFQIVKAGFSSPRKQLAGNLANGLKIERHMVEEALKKSGIEPSQRAETLEVGEWIKLTEILNPKS